MLAKVQVSFMICIIQKTNFVREFKLEV